MRKNSTQKLIGFERFTRYGVKTDRCEFVFYHVEPTNLSVLSQSNVAMKIQNLNMLLADVPELEILALDTCECFDSNKAFLQKRIAEEQNEAVRRLLRQDCEFLDAIQTEMATTREFLFVLRFFRETEEQIFHFLTQVESAIAKRGFTYRRMSKADTKRLLAVYFGTSVTGDAIEDIEGEDQIKEGYYAQENDS